MGVSLVRGLGFGVSCVAMAPADPDFSKAQLSLFLREWYMHPNGQIPAYEWAFGDVNPPVHAWAAGVSSRSISKSKASPISRFLERVFHKLLMNFTWWVNRKDSEGAQHFRRRVPGSRQHRHLRSQFSASVRMASRAIGWLELDGHVLPEHAQDGAATLQRRHRLRRHCEQVF